jgi:prepilin-type processing-associated H-X9-DG protein
MLLQKGAVVSLKDDRGSTASMYAESEGHPDILLLLKISANERRERGQYKDFRTEGEKERKDEEADERTTNHTSSSTPVLNDDIESNIEDIARCANNMRQLGLALSRFAKEHRDIFPRVSDIKGNFIFAGKLLYPEYVRDIEILACPGDTGYDKEQSFRLKNNVRHPDSRIGELHPDCITCESYIYLGWMLTSEKEGLAAIDAYISISSNEHNNSLIVPDGYGNLNGNVIRRLTLGVDRFLISDSNAVLHGKPSPASEIPVIWEWPSNHGKGGNVLYLDGHVEFVPYPGKFPMTKPFIEALKEIKPEFE